jgi:hypothetical protein
MQDQDQPPELRRADRPDPRPVRWHPDLAALPVGSVVRGQVQDLPIEAPILEMEVTRVDAEGAGFRFLQGD